MRTRLHSHHHHLYALAAYLLLTLIFTYPLITHFNTHVLSVANPDGTVMRTDAMEYVWKMRWVAHAVFDVGVSPLFVPHVYYPFGYPLAYGEITPIHTYGMLPFTQLFGAVVAYNLTAIGSTVLSGWAVYMLARHFLRKFSFKEDRLSLSAAFFAGAAFAFSAYRMQKLGGHLPLFDTHWLVWAFLAFDRWWGKRRLSDVLLLGMFTAFAALSSWYYGLMLAMLLPVYALASGSQRAALRDRRTYRGAIIAVGIILALCLPFLLPYIGLESEGATRVPLEDASFWAASPTDYGMPNPLHPLWGDAVQRVMWPFPGGMPIEFTIAIGWVTLLFALVGLRRTHDKTWRALKWTAFAAFILSLGPYLHISRLPLPVPLPVLLLREIMPIADSIRSWGRFSVVVMMSCAVLASAGIVFTLKHLSPRRQTLGMGLTLGLMLFGSWNGAFPISPIVPRAVDTWLAAQPSTAPIMEFPLGIALSGPAILSTDYHGKPVTFGYGTYLPLLYRQRHPELTEFPANSTLDTLKLWGVEYILVTENALNGEPYTLADINLQSRLQRLEMFDGVIVYRLLQ